MGTSVTAGSATAVIVKTGSATEYGEIAKKSAERKPETEFETGLRRFGYLIMQVTFVLIIAVFFINALFKHTRHGFTAFFRRSGRRADPGFVTGDSFH